MKSIGISGIKSEDIIMHMAHVMEEFGLNVCVSNKNGDFMSGDIPFSEEGMVNDFDYCLYPDDLRENKFRTRDKKIIVTDILPYNARKIRKEISDCGIFTDVLLVIRDITGQNSGKNYICDLIGIKGEPIIIHETKEDIFVRCRIEEGMKYKIKDLSRGMTAGITEILLRLGVITLNDIKNSGRRGHINKWEKYLRFIKKQKEMRV